MKHSRYILGCTAFAGMCILILDSKTALIGAKSGIALCIQCLIPSVFPFLVLSSILTTAFLGSSFPLLRPIAGMFGIPKGCESILIPAFLGGYPAGAQAVGQACHLGRISVETAQQLLVFCNNPGPSFLFGVLAAAFPNAGFLWMLWGIQILSAFLCSRIFSCETTEVVSIEENSGSFSADIVSTVRIMGTICGWVVLFRVVIAFLERWLLWLLPPAVQTAVQGCLELSNGCFSLLCIGDIRLRFVICTGMLSFGGLCVLMQTGSVIHDLSLKPYILGKLIQCLISLGLSAGIVYRNAAFLLFTGILWFLTKKTVAIRRRMMYNKHTKLRRTQYAVS